MRAALLAVALLAAACDARETVIVATDAATDAVSPDAGTPPADAAPDAEIAIEPTGGSECDQQDSCAACVTCAAGPFEPCVDAALTCEDSAECTALVGCINGCTTDDCIRACASAHPGGVDGVRAWLVCDYCTACPADCRDRHDAWCGTTLF